MSLTTRILAALILGILLGAGLEALAPAFAVQAAGVAEPIGGVWLDLLRMTIIPLVFSLIVTGVAQAADTAAAGSAAGRTLLLFVVLLFAGAIFSALATPAILALWPAPVEAAQALRASANASAVPAMPPIAEFLKTFIPANPVKVAAEGAMAPLVVFALLFGLAATRIPPASHQRLTGFFEAVAQTMMVLVHWVLWLAPIGVFALALVVGARTGFGALGVLGHYVVVMSLIGAGIVVLAFLVAVFAGRVAPGRFIKAMTPTLAVALSTQSSLACLPAMLDAGEKLDIPRAVRGLVLPLAVALFRMTSPAVNLAVVIYVAHLYGVALDPLRLATGVAVAAVVSLAAVGIASAATFFTTLVPISLAMGVPLEILPLLLAVETLPDIFRTLGNVTADVAVTTVAARGAPAEVAEPAPA
jgi:proton glutamate symport protein